MAANIGLICLVILSIVRCKDIFPTISNSSGDYYINSQATTTTFQFDTITCSANNCVIICDAISGCYGMNINGELSQTLTIWCANVNACYQSNIIASSTSTTIQCNNVNSCYQTNVSVNTSSMLDLYCDAVQHITNPADSPCHGINIYANEAETVNIYAYSYYSAYQMNIYGANINGSLNINCGSDGVCLESIIYCPIGKNCNINCSQQHSCTNTDIFLPNHQYQGLHFNCNNTLNNSCLNSNIHCINSDGITNWYYSAINMEWECGDYECCPFKDEIIACNSGEDCILNCTTTICANKQIDASLATSLELDCNSYASCQGSNILCPTGDDTSCDIICSGILSCSYSIFHTTAPTQDTFSLECSGANSCEWSSISVLSTLLIKQLLFSCTERNACSNMNISFNYATAIINTLSVICMKNESCSSLSMHTFNTKVYSMNMDCIGNEINACKSVNISTAITHDINLNCVSLSSCKNARFAFVLGNEATANIACSNAYITADPNLGACHDAVFSGNPFSDDIGNKVYVTCNQNDCIQTDFEFYYMDNIEIICNSPYSCHEVIINGSESNLLMIDCEEANACSSSSIYCPYSTINSCIINCKEYDYVCKDMNIYTPNEYKHNYLNMTCSSSPDNNQEPCNDIQFNCYGLPYGKSGVEYIYDTEQQQYICQYPYLYRCCPFLSGGTITPCSPNEDCFIDCNSNKCTNAYINGSSANTLIVNCTTTKACADSIIFCPNGDCTINCDVDLSACENAKIYHYGTKSDQAVVSLNCYRYGACKNMDLYANNAKTITVDAKTYVPYVSIHGENVENINIECGSGRYRAKPNRQSGGAGCFAVNVYANNAENIDIKCSNYYGCDAMDLYADNATFVRIEATQIKGWNNGKLFASNANSVEIYCSQSRYTDCGACQPGTACTGEWYIPSNTVFACYGYGCNGLGTVSVMDKSVASDIEMNINGCAECCDIDECMKGFVLQCNDSRISVDPPSICGDNMCGCNELLSEIRNSFRNNENDGNCVRTTSGGYIASCASNYNVLTGSELTGVIIGIVLVCCCLLCLGIWCRRRSRSYLERHLNMHRTEAIEIQQEKRTKNDKTSKKHQLVNTNDDDLPSYDTVR